LGFEGDETGALRSAVLHARMPLPQQQHDRRDRDQQDPEHSEAAIVGHDQRLLVDHMRQLRDRAQSGRRGL
jgi:hypothetical protein